MGADGADIYYTRHVKNTPRSGTVPNRPPEPSGTRGPTPLPELATARARVLTTVARREDIGYPTTISDLAADLGGHPNTTRAHVGELVAQGLLERVPVSDGSRGRPAHEHRLTDRGRLVLEAVGVAEPVTTDELVTAMAEHLSTTPDAESHARAIGRLWATQLRRAAPGVAVPADPADRVTALLRTAGFSPRPEPSGDVALRTCPVLASARAHPGIVCTMHEEMLRAALEDPGDAEVDVVLAPFARDGACLVHLDRR